MLSEEAQGNIDCPTSSGSIEETINSLCDAVESLQNRLEKKDDRISELEERVEQLESDADQRDVRLDAVGTAIETLFDGQAELEDSVDDIECCNPPGQSGENTAPQSSETPETPLERVVGLPEQIVESELSANQQRARFIASDVEDYSRKVPAGYSIDTGSLRRVLSAAEESRVHTQTVSRVVEFLSRLGDGAVKVVDRRGKRRVVFDKELVGRLQQARENRTDDAGRNHGVVMTQTG